MGLSGPLEYMASNTGLSTEKVPVKQVFSLFLDNCIDLDTFIQVDLDFLGLSLRYAPLAFRLFRFVADGELLRFFDNQWV